MNNTRPERALTRSIGYVLLVVALLAGALVFDRMTWKGNGEMHTLLETIATVLLLIAGVMSLVRYYTKKSSAFLLSMIEKLLDTKRSVQPGNSACVPDPIVTLPK